MIQQGGPPGVVGIYVDPDGRVIASVSDFNSDCPSHLKTYEAQEHRAKYRLARAVLNRYCSPVVNEAVDDYDATRIVSRLKGKMIFIPVGYPEDVKL